MKKILFLFLMTISAMAQVPGVVYQTTPPSGACSATPPIRVVSANGHVCTCAGGTWSCGSGGSGQVSSAKKGQLGYFNADGTTIGGITTNITYATAYGVKADGLSVHDASTTNGSPNITCPNSDCNFSSADVGKVIYATNATYDSTEWQSIVIVPRSTILSVTNANSIVVSNNATSTVTALATVIYGSLDSAVASATQSTANDPLFAAWTAAQQSCTPLQLPAGMMLVEQPEFTTYSATVACGNNFAQYNLRRGGTIQGNGMNSTILVITPDLVGSKCTGPNGSGNGCFFSVPTLTVENLQIWGGGNSTLTGFSGKTGVYVPGITAGVGTNSRFDNVTMHGWGTQTSGFQGMNIGEGVNSALSNVWMTNLNMEAWGNAELVIDTGFTDPTGGGQVFMTQSYVVTCGIACVDLKTGQLQSSNNLFGQETLSTGANDVIVEAGTLFNSSNDQWEFGNGANTSMLYVYGVANLTNDYIKATGYGIGIDAAGAVRMTQTSVSSSTPANSLFVAGALTDNGGNSYPGITFSGAGVRYLGGYVYGGITYTTATSDAATIPGVSSSSHCFLTPTNSTAAASTVGASLTASTNTVTVNHVATTASGGTANIFCTTY